MMKYLNFITFLILCISFYSINAEQTLTLSKCEDLKPNQIQKRDLIHSDSLFWKIEKKGYKTSYLYGTIHASDPRVLDVPNNVLTALKNSDQFIMESLLSPESEVSLSKKMFSAYKTPIDEYIEQDVLAKIIDILSTHNIPEEYVKFMQPWAAYLIMNYPPNNGMFLDLKLLDIAKNHNKQLIGLETLDQQLAFFNQLEHHEQIKMLFDTVCNYETIQNDLKQMINYYIKRDLRKLISVTNKYSIVHEPVYKKLYEKLVNVRNHNMARKIIKHTKSDSSFIAIGSLHIVGNKGVVALLKRHGYKLTPIH